MLAEYHYSKRHLLRNRFMAQYHGRYYDFEIGNIAEQ